VDGCVVIISTTCTLLSGQWFSQCKNHLTSRSGEKCMISLDVFLKICPISLKIHGPHRRYFEMLC